MGIKSKTVKFLKSKGIRYMEKQGCGRVPLGHIKTVDLIRRASQFSDF